MLQADRQQAIEILERDDVELILTEADPPLSLPSLVIGRDVPIYDPKNSGRSYKIGYICGVNICGLVFIGPLFWRPRPTTSASSGKSR